MAAVYGTGNGSDRLVAIRCDVSMPSQICCVPSSVSASSTVSEITRRRWNDFSQVGFVRRIGRPIGCSSRMRRTARGGAGSPAILGRSVVTATLPPVL